MVCVYWGKGSVTWEKWTAKHYNETADGWDKLDELGKRGRALPDLSVPAATKRIMGLQKTLLAER